MIIERMCLLFFGLLATACATADPLDNPSGSGALAPELVETADGAVLTWLEPAGGGHALRFAAFENGEFGPASEIARGTGWFANWADTPRLFIAPDGDWIAHWPVKSGDSTYAYDVIASRSSDRGATWSPPTSPHRDGTQTEHGFVSYFGDPDGTAHLVWLDGRNTGSAAGHGSHGEGSGAMTLRTASMVGAAFGPSVELDGRVCDCCQTASATTAAGPIVIYRDRSEDEVRDIHIVRRIEGHWTAPRPVVEDGWIIGGCPVNGPDVVADGRRVAAAWFTMADNVPAAQLAVSQDAGASFGPAASFSAGSALGRVQLANTADGFLMIWMDEIDGRAVLKLARFGESGALLGERELAGLGAGRGSGFPRLAVIADRVLVAWTASETNADDERTTHVRTAFYPMESPTDPSTDSPASG